jgi:hypothetical protein
VRAAPSPVNEGPCVIASVLGASRARLRSVAQVAARLEVACKAALVSSAGSARSSLTTGGPLPRW